MNIIFSLITTLSIILLIFKNPNAMLTAFTLGTNNAVKLSMTLITVYTVWLGFNEILKQSGVNNKLSNLLKKPIKKLFKTNDDDAISSISLTLSANVLGLGGVATPMAIKYMQLLDSKENEYAKNMLFVISSTSIQIIPLSVMQLLSEKGAENPSSIFLPTLIFTFLSTLIGVILVKVFS